jgi:hypothetical protein
MKHPIPIPANNTHHHSATANQRFENNYVISSKVRSLKNIVLLTLILIAFEINVAQNYHPIEFYNSGWNNVGWIMEGNNFPQKADLYKCYFLADTVIGNMSYHTFYHHRIRYDVNNGNNILHSDSNNYIGAMRTERKSYYFIPKGNLEERLIYDFNLSINDTVPLGFYPAPASYKIIDDTSTITLNDGTTRVHFRAKILDSLGNFVSFCFYDEGVGDTKSLVHPDLYAVQSYDGGFERLTYCENGELLYSLPGLYWEPGNDCDFTVSIKQWALGSNNNLIVTPNPFFGNSFSFKLKTLDNLTKEYSLRIYNNIGKEVFSNKIPLQSNRHQSLDINLSPGMYLLVLTDGDKSFFTAKIIKSK